LATTMRAPAVPKNLILSAIFRNAGSNCIIHCRAVPSKVKQSDPSPKKKDFTQMSTTFYAP
jgi:hypothetical protein